MIEAIEGFRSKFDVAGLAERNGLHKREIDVLVAWAFNGIHAQVTERSGLRILKGAGVEERRCCAWAD